MLKKRRQMKIRYFLGNINEMFINDIYIIIFKLIKFIFVWKSNWK